jgi:hypothetical protein
MSSPLLAEWFDNPILVKHIRSRLRLQSLASSIVVVVVLCVCIAWGGFVLDSFTSGGAFGALFALQSVILAVMGTTQIGTSVGTARASGILDFHRVSPLSPTELVLGFFFGAPIREYVLFACTLPFSLLCLAFGTPDFRGLLQLMILLVSSSWLLHAFTLLNALILKKQAGSRGVVGAVVLLGVMSSSVLPGFLQIAAVVESEPRLDFYGISLPWLAVVLLYQLPTLFFLFLASRRKMDSERFHPFSKIQAVAAMATLGLLMVGGVWSLTNFDSLALVVVYALVLVGILLTTTVTPTQAEYYKGLCRAHKLGKPRLSLWDDLALNRPFLAIACTVVLCTSTIAWNQLSRSGPGGSDIVRQAYPLAIANGVIVMAYFGLALQFFLLRFGRRGPNYLSLFLFLVWVVPLIAGTIYILADWRGRGEGPAQVIYALSPVAGIAMTAGTAGTGGSDFLAVAGAAITPSLFFAFLFNGLLTAARRRVQRAVVIATEKSGSAAEIAA